jgi:hypothetical protein
MPFIHIRASFVAVTLMCYLAYLIWYSPKNRERNQDIAITSIVTFISIIGFILFQQKMANGGLSASAPFTPSFGMFFDRLAVQLFSYRHGLLLYNPLAIVGFSGLILGLINGNKLISLCLITLISYLITFVWGSASESFPARFWVFIIPIILIGSIYWWQECHSKLKLLIIFPLACISLLNTIYFVLHPNKFLENRFGSLTYDNLFYFFNENLNFSINAVKDPFDYGKIALIDSQGSSTVLLVIFILILVILLFGLAKNKRVLGILAATLAIGYSLIISSSFISSITNQQVRTQIGENENGYTYITFLIDSKKCINGFKIGKISDYPLWGLDESKPAEFIVVGINSGGRILFNKHIPAFQIYKMENCTPLQTLTITGVDKKATDWAKMKIILF